MSERSAIVAYLRKSAAILLTSDIPLFPDADDRRELETAARAIEIAADEIEGGMHIWRPS